jgi:hypothetical protein
VVHRLVQNAKRKRNWPEVKVEVAFNPLCFNVSYIIIMFKKFRAVFICVIMQLWH